MTVHTERRTQARKRPLSLVYVELPPSNGGMMRDLSDQGFALRAMMPLEPSEKLPFAFSLDNGVRVDGEAIVLRVEDGGNVAALEFAGLPAHSRDQIRRWLEKFDEPLSRESALPKPPKEPASTFEELREEARTVAARPPVPQIEPELPQPPFPPQPTEAPSLPPLEQKPLHTTAAAQPGEPEPQPEPPPPSLPPLQQPPPLLRLSAVRPAPPPEAPAEPVLPAAPVHPDPTPAPPAPAPLQEVLIQPPSVTAAQHPSSSSSSAPRVTAPRRLAPPLEPLSSLEAQRDEGSTGLTQTFTLGRAIRIMLVITFLVGCYVYHREVGHGLIWLGQQIAGEEPPENSQAAQPSGLPVVPSNPEPTAKASPDASLTQNKSAAVPPAPENPAETPKDTKPNVAVPTTDVQRTSSASSSSGTGQQDYQQALRILHAPNRKAELPEAVRLLWVAVKAGNVGAEITLAELYHQGRGVPKSCDQTRILLSAAARKGSRDARKRLDDFRREGCRD